VEPTVQKIHCFLYISVADPDHFDADPDPDPTSEKNRIRIRIRPLKKTGSGSDHALYKMAYKTYLLT
jgi:hypothetical protein